MGIFDSNSVSQLQLNGSFVCDLTTTGSQNQINLKGFASSCIRIVVSDAPAEDFTIAVKSSTAEATGVNSDIYDKDFNNIGTFITGNGTYYVKLDGRSYLHFSVARTIASGNATIDWALVPSSLFGMDENVKQVADYINQNIELSEEETLSLASVTNIKTITPDIHKFKCIAIFVKTISEGAVVKVFRNSQNVTFYDDCGNIYDGMIKSTGFFYIPCNYPFDIVLRNSVAVTDGSMVVKICLLRDFPHEILDMKPVQLIASSITSIGQSTGQRVLNYTETTNIKNFKFFYVAYTVKNGTSTVNRHVIITSQPYNDTSGLSNEILEGTRYSNQSSWQEVNGYSGIRLYATIDDYQEGDTIETRLYGIR